MLGEYTGVWDTKENVTQRIDRDPMGLGVMRRDKVAALAYTGAKAPQEARKGMS